MGKRSRRHFRLPVLSRLTWAWLIFGFTATGLTVYSMTAGRNAEGPTRITLALDSKLETMARPAAKPPQTVAALNDEVRPRPPSESETPPLRDGAPHEEPFSLETDDDLLAGASSSVAPYTDETLQVEPSDIVITIDGAPAETPRARTVRPQSASFAAPTPIPDPDRALLQQSRFGPIPQISGDGRRAADLYARPFERDDATRVAIIVGGLGLNPSLTERAIDELPPEITLAFAPYAKNLDRWTARARAAGHEIMIELPMEGYGGGIDALGPAALTTGRTAGENLQRLDWLLARFGGYFGVTNYLGAKFSADSEALSVVLARLDELGLAYVDDTGAAQRALSGAARAATVNRVIAGGQHDRAVVRNDLDALEKIAARDGDALGKTYAYDETISALSEWTSELSRRNIALAPVSAVLHGRRAGG